MRILIVEDEFNLADAVSSRLKGENYAVDIATDGKVGLEDALTDSYDLIILDVMLPHINGFDILKELRKENISSKIIMLTAKYKIEDKLEGFNKGADDYLTKPFHMDELIARVNVQLRKNSSNQDSTLLKVGDLELNLSKMNLSNINTKENVDIIGKEFGLLELFMRNPNIVITRDNIYNKIWGFDNEAESNNLEAYLSFIRRKLKLISSKTQIKAIRGMGYKMEVDDEKTK